MDVFQEYKPLRNKIRLLARDDALRVIWAYSQYLQIDEFQIQADIEAAKEYLADDFPQRWIAEWDLEVLAKEIILNANAQASRGRTLRNWKTLSETVNALKALENSIYSKYGSEKNVLIEVIRIAHRQFVWQGNPPNSTTTMRYYKIFSCDGINQVCLDRLRSSPVLAG